MDSEPTGLCVYYYVDKKGNQHGSVNEYKTKMMALQNYCDEIYKTDIADYTGHLMSDKYHDCINH